MSTILVVEDDLRIQKALHRQFTMEGYTVHVSGDGAEGLAACKTLRPAGVVLDLMLPGMDGLDVCRELRATEATRSLPILMLTAKAEETDQVVGFSLGADDYVTKPFSVKVLLQRIKAGHRRVEGPAESVE